MTKQTIDNLQPGTLDGDSLFRTAEKINENFNEIYSHFGDGQNLDDGYAGLKGLNAGFITSAGAGAYNVRELVAGSTAVSVINGTGSGGNPTIDLPDTGVLPAGASATSFADQGITVDTKGRITSIITPAFLASAQAAASTATSSATASATSATASAASATSAANDVATIGTSLADAATHATNAGNSATAAAASATTAQNQVTTTTTNATNASNSETAAATSATNASNSATAASTSATNASNSASAAATSATNAAASLASMGNNVTQAQTAATNAANSFDAFDDIFLGAKSSAPTVDNDGDALQTGALYFNTGSDTMFIRTSGGSWTAAGSAVNGTTNRSSYVATANQTTFASVYDVGYLDVYLNGIKLSAADFTATNGTSFVLASGASVGDQVDAIGYGAFSVADVYTKSESNTLLAAKATTADLTTTNTNVTNLTTTVGTKASQADLNTLTTTVGTKAPLASPALTGTPTVNGAAIATGTSDSTLGTLTQAFTAGQQTTINLSSNALSPSVAVTKEVPQIGITNNQWNVDSSGTGNYTRYNTAPATTISFSGTTATLGSGSFSASDVGKTIEVNNGKLILTNANGTFSVASTPDNYNQAASGAWQMYSLVFNATDTDLEISSTLTNAYDLSTAVYSKTYNTSPQQTQPNAIEWVDNGTKIFILNTIQNVVYAYAASTPYDVGSLSYISERSVSSGDNSNMGLAVKPDGTVFYVIGTQYNAVYSFNMSTPYDPSSAAGQYSSTFSCNTQLNNQGTQAHSLFFKPDGTAFYVNGYSTATGRVYQYDLNTAWDITTAGYSNYGPAVVSYNQGLTFNSDGTRFYIGERGGKTIRTYQINNTAWSLYDVSGPIASFSVSSQIDYPDGLAFNNDGSRFYVTGPSRDDIVQWDVGSMLAPSGYHAAHTTTSIDSTTWTDINSMTATDSAGTGSVNYAVSTDDRTTWKIAHNTNGARNIVKNNSGTWQYNSNATYGSETWVNGSTNNELATLQQAMEAAQLATNAYNTNNAGAGYGNNFNVGINPQGMALTPDGNTIFIMSDNQNLIKSYSLSAPFSLATTPSNTGSFDYSSQTTSEQGFCFADSGTKLYILGVNSGTFLWQYSLSTAYDLSTVSYVRAKNIDSVTGQPRGVQFKPDGSKMFITDKDGTGAIYEWALTTNFDISTASNTANFSVNSETTAPMGLHLSADGTKFVIVGATDNKVRVYTMSTAYDVTSASLTMTTNISPYVSSGNVTEVTFNPLGTIMFICDYSLSSGRITDFTLGSSSFTNQMNKTQLDAVSDANQFAVADDLDLAIILNLASGTGVPSSDGVSINYDANVSNQGAILGTDYNYDVPALNKVRITAVNAATLKVRVV